MIYSLNINSINDNQMLDAILVDTFHVKMVVFVYLMDFVSVQIQMDSMEQHAQVFNFRFFYYSSFLFNLFKLLPPAQLS